MPKTHCRRSLHLVQRALCALACVLPVGALGQNLLDHRWQQERSGIYGSPDALPIAMSLVVAGGALYEGSDTRLGRTFWQSGETATVGLLLAKGLQRLTRRQSPESTSDPNQWFQDSKQRSFPSGHVTVVTSFVTPFILECQHEQPWVWALAALPVYEMVARVKARQHWQSDVLAGAALGAAVGWVEHGRKSPWIVGLLPGGVFVGYRKQFK